jgi:hypothetical protein
VKEWGTPYGSCIGVSGLGRKKVHIPIVDRSLYVER